MENLKLREDGLSQDRSFGSNYQRCSQPRKISIGILVDSITNSQTKGVKEAEVQIAENKSPRVKNCEGCTSIPQKETAVPPKDASPWVSTRPFNTKVFSSSVHEAENTPGCPKKACPRSKPSKKAPAAQAVKIFFGKVLDFKSDEGRLKKFVKATCDVESGNLSNAQQIKSAVFSTEQRVFPQKELVEDKHRKPQNGGSETLRMKLWDILENVSSPEKQCPGSEPVEMPTDQERDGKHSHIEKENSNSDTIESDSERPDYTSRRPLTRSLTKTKASTRTKGNEVNAAKPSSHKKQCPQKSIFSHRGDWSGRLHNTASDDSLPYQRNKIEKKSSGAQKCQDHKYENAEERRQMEIKNTTSAVQKSMFQRNIVDNANSSNDGKSDAFVEPKSRNKKQNSFEFQPDLMTEKPRDVEQPRDIFEVTELKNQQEDMTNSFSKKKRDSIHDTTGPTFEIKSTKQNSFPHHLPKSNLGKIHKHSPGENIITSKGIQSFKDLSNSKPDECKSNAQYRGGELKDCLAKKSCFIVEDRENRPSGMPIATDSESSEDESHIEVKNNGGGKLKDCHPMTSRFIVEEDTEHELSKSPADMTDSESSQADSHIKDVKDNGEELKDCPAMEASFTMEENRENRPSKLPTVNMDSESSEDDSEIEGCRASEPLSPELCIAQRFLHGRRNKRLRKDKSVEMTNRSPIPETGIEDSGELQMHKQQNHNDGLASAIALLTVALGRVKTKLKSMTSAKSAEILRSAAEEIFLQLQNAESHIKTDMGKLANHYKLKRKRVEARFQEQQEKLLGIHKKFKEEVGKHLEDYGSIIQELEGHEIQLKEAAERQRATHKQLYSQAEQAIKDKLDDAESRVMTVQEMSKKKMLQLKLVIAELQNGVIC